MTVSRSDQTLVEILEIASAISGATARTISARAAAGSSASSPPAALIAAAASSCSWPVRARWNATASRIASANARAALSAPDVRKKISEFGHNPVGSTPSETAAFVRAESARYKAIIEQGKITLN